MNVYTQKRAGSPPDELTVAKSRISELETPYGKLPSLKTLRRVAKVFDVALLVHFSSWSQFIDFAASFEAIAPSFDDESQKGSGA